MRKPALKLAVLLASLLSLGQPLALEPEYRWLSQSEIDAGLRACGVQHFTIRYDDDLQSDIVELRDVQVTDEQLSFVYRATDYTPYVVLWAEPHLGLRYLEIGDQLARPRALTRAKAYFDARPELGPPPTREEGQSELDFARSIERFCGPLASGAFATEFGTLTISAEWLSAYDLTEISDPFGCLIQASILNDLELGFFGNERLSEAPE